MVVRNPTAPYIAKRTSQALKVKSFKDAECKIIGYTEGRGKFKQKVGALKCQLKNDIIFSIGSGLSDSDRANPPAIGSIVTFKYTDFTKYNKPRFPIYLRVRQ